MAPYVSYLPSEMVSSDRTELVDSLKEKNEKFLADIDTKLKDAEENLGESDVSELWRSRAMYLCRIGDKVSCIKWIAVMSIS
jgi:26S proteasome regulatory subunit N7